MRQFTWYRMLAATAAVTALACTDAPSAPSTTADASADYTSAADAHRWFEHYVAMGTSISQGWASEGILAASQHESWPAQLARMAGRELTQPYIDAPGCRSPWAVPLVQFRRVSGEPLPSSPTLSCAPNSAGVTLPAANVAVTGARAIQALLETPQTIPATDANAKHYSRILPPNTTQVQAMRLQRPQLVSVEFGGNEVLGANGGLLRMPQIIEDPVVYAQRMDQIFAKVREVRPEGVLVVGMPADLSRIPGFRTGSEIWADRLALLGAFNVSVNENCGGNPNLVTVPAVVVPTIGAGLQAKQAGKGPVPLSCANRPDVADGILTPNDVTKLRWVLGVMSTHLKNRVRESRWAYFDLGVLYDATWAKPPFSSIALMTSLEPYGPYFSADGFHPSALGQTVLASAAARALNARYNLGLVPTLALTANPFLSR